VKSKQQMALADIANIATAAEQDISDIDKWWPPTKRGSNAGRAFDRLVNRVRQIAKTAKENDS
jgi:hypothetical protein